MALKTWTLIGDADQATVDTSGTPFSVNRRTLRGGKRDGVELIEIDNGVLRIAVLPQRGMGLWKAWLGDLEIGWQSPVQGPVHPCWVPISDPGGLGWLEGFDELMCRCGLESNGAPDFDEQGRLAYPLHGRISNLPAHRLILTIDDETEELTLTGEVDETRFHFQKLRLQATYRIKKGEPRIVIHDEIQNLSASPAGVELLYHVNFGLPWLDPGSQLIAPVKELVPRDEVAAAAVAKWQHYANEEAGFAEQVYFLNLLEDSNKNTQVLLRNAHGNHGVSLRFDKRQLPCFTQWKNTTTGPDGYVTGLEPGINFPNPRSFEKEQGRVATIEGRGSRIFELALEFHTSAEQVARAEKEVKALQGNIEPKIYESPRAGWSPS